MEKDNLHRDLFDELPSNFSFAEFYSWFPRAKIDLEILFLACEKFKRITFTNLDTNTYGQNLQIKTHKEVEYIEI